MRSWSPFLRLTPGQFLGVAVMATSQETAPAGSKYLAAERKMCTVSPLP